MTTRPPITLRVHQVDHVALVARDDRFVRDSVHGHLDRLVHVHEPIVEADLDRRDLFGRDVDRVRFRIGLGRQGRLVVDVHPIGGDPVGPARLTDGRKADLERIGLALVLLHPSPGFGHSALGRMGALGSFTERLDKTRRSLAFAKEVHRDVAQVVGRGCVELAHSDQAREEVREPVRRRRSGGEPLARANDEDAIHVDRKGPQGRAQREHDGVDSALPGPVAAVAFDMYDQEDGGLPQAGVRPLRVQHRGRVDAGVGNDHDQRIHALRAVFLGRGIGVDDLLIGPVVLGRGLDLALHHAPLERLDRREAEDLLPVLDRRQDVLLLQLFLGLLERLGQLVEGGLNVLHLILGLPVLGYILSELLVIRLLEEQIAQRRVDRRGGRRGKRDRGGPSDEGEGTKELRVTHGHGESVFGFGARPEGGSKVVPHPRRAQAEGLGDSIDARKPRRAAERRPASRSSRESMRFASSEP